MIDVEFLSQVLFFMALFILIAIYVEFREVRRLLKEVRDAVAATAYYMYYVYSAPAGGQDHGEKTREEGAQSGADQSVEATKDELCVIEYLRSVNCAQLSDIKRVCKNATQATVKRVAEARRVDNKLVYCIKTE